MSTLAIVCVFGVDVGLGHLRRSERLQVALKSVCSSKVNLFATEKETFDAAHLLDMSFTVLILDLPSDLYTRELDGVLATLRRSGSRVVAIDGPCSGIDLLIVPSFHVKSECFAHARRSHVPVLWGWSRLIIEQRKSIALRAQGSPVLVLTGGSDASGLARSLPTALDARLPRGTPVHWVTGPLASPPILPSKQNLQWTEHRNVTDIRPIMESAGYALALYGVTALELLHHGVPSVLVSLYGDRDTEHLAVLERESLARTSHGMDSAVDELCALLANQDQASILASRSSERIPFAGTNRVAREICELTL